MKSNEQAWREFLDFLCLSNVKFLSTLRQLSNETIPSFIIKEKRSKNSVMSVLSRKCIVFLPVTGLKCSYGKISIPLTEILVGKPRSRHLSQPALGVSYDHIEIFTKTFEVRRDLGNRAHMKRPLNTNACDRFIS